MCPKNLESLPLYVHSLLCNPFNPYFSESARGAVEEGVQKDVVYPQVLVWYSGVET